MIPLLAISLGLALEWAQAPCRPVFATALLPIAFSIGVQGMGATVYPSGSEDHAAGEGDRFKTRLWDWSDIELTRSIQVSRAYRSAFRSTEDSQRAAKLTDQPTGARP